MGGRHQAVHSLRLHQPRQSRTTLLAMSMFSSVSSFLDQQSQPQIDAHVLPEPLGSRGGIALIKGYITNKTDISECKTLLVFHGCFHEIQERGSV